MGKRAFVMAVLVLLLSAVVRGVTDEEIAAAVVLFPDGQDVAVTLSDEGKAAVDLAIEILEDALGIDVLFDHTNEDTESVVLCLPVVNEPDYCDTCIDCPVSGDVNDYFENRLTLAQYCLVEMDLWDKAVRALQSILDDPIGDRFPLYNTTVLSKPRSC